MEEWGIPREKVLTTMPDNGSNMVPSFQTHADVASATTSEQDSEAEHDGANGHYEQQGRGGEMMLEIHSAFMKLVMI